MAGIGSALLLFSTLFWLSLGRAQGAPQIELTQAQRDWLAANPEILIGRCEQADQLHRLRGAAGVLGAEHLEEPTRRLQDALRLDGRSDARMRARFIVEGERLMTTLSSFEISSRATEPTTDAVIRSRAVDALDLS